MYNFVKPYKKKHKNKYIEGMIYEETGDNLELLYEETGISYAYYTYDNKGRVETSHVFLKATQMLTGQIIFIYDNNNNTIGRLSLSDNLGTIIIKKFNENNICIRNLFYTYKNDAKKIKKLQRSIKLKLDDNDNIIFLKDDNRIYNTYLQYSAKFSGKNIIEYNDPLGNYWNLNYGHDLYMPYAILSKDKIYQLINEN